MPSFLPKLGVMDTVRMKDGGAVPERRPIAAFFCSHSTRRDYVRIDHRAGPGSFADNFEGEVCGNCGYIVQEVQTL